MYFYVGERTHSGLYGFWTENIGGIFGGENLYEKTLSGNGILIMGNEGNGIRPAIEAFVNEKLYIPNYPEGRDTSESLNVAIATAVVCAEFRRRQGNPA